MNEDVVREFYASTLKEAAAVANRSVSNGFEESRKRTWGEFRDFCSLVGKDPLEARDLDVIAFVHGYWLPRHRSACRTMVGVNKERTASASAIKGVVSHLSKSFNMFGKVGERNPALAESVRNYREGYRNALHDSGVREKRAVVFKEGKVQDLITWLENQIGKSSGLARCALLSDLTIVHYLWESWSRGKECGELESRQIVFDEQIVRAGWSKTVHEEPSAEIAVQKGFLQSAARLISACDEARVPVGSGFLFRPLNERKDAFKMEPMSSGTMRRRIQQRLKDAGLFEGETLHSFRRSAVQHAAGIEGYNVEKLMQRGRWSSYAAFRLYIEEIEREFPRRTCTR